MENHTDYLVFGFSGPSGSGKTTITKEYTERFPNDSVIMTFDNYYPDLSLLSIEERSQTNFDDPNLIDWILFESHIKKLLSGKSINRPNYDFKTHTRSQETTTVEPKRIIVIEGIFTLTKDSIAKICNQTIAVMADLDTCLARRIMRDINERGRTVESVIQQWVTQVAPMYRNVIWPETKKRAKHLFQSPHFEDEKEMVKYYKEIAEPFLEMSENWLRKKGCFK